MLSLDKVLSTIQDAINAIPTPKMAAPPSLLYCTAIKRNGSTPAEQTAYIETLLGDMGFKCSDKQTQFIYALAKGQFKTIGETAFQSVMPPGTPLIGTGGNSGGPVVINGYTSDFASGYAISTQKED